MTGHDRLVGDDIVGALIVSGSEPTALHFGCVGFALPAHLSAVARLLPAASPGTGGGIWLGQPPTRR